MKAQTLTVGFADLSNWQKFSGAVPPEAAVETLNEAYIHAGDAITVHGGTILKYLGDAVMFSFEDPAAAMRAAENIVSGFRRVEVGVETKFRVGLATGTVYSSIVGHTSLRREDIFGDPVNRAALLLRDAGQSDVGVAICDETRRLIAGDDT